MVFKITTRVDAQSAAIARALASNVLSQAHALGVSGGAQVNAR
jgi:hypothetical protein